MISERLEAPARDGERCAAGKLRLAVIFSVSAGCCRWKSSRASLHTGVPFHLATPAAVSISAPSANVGSSSKRRERRWEPPEASARPTAGERWRASGRSTLIVPRACDGSSMRRLPALAAGPAHERASGSPRGTVKRQHHTSS